MSATAFADAVIERLGETAGVASARSARGRLVIPAISDSPRKVATRAVVGMDVFVEWDRTPEELGASLEAVTAGTVLRLKMVSNRGTVVYPAREAVPTLVDHVRCRFLAADGVEPIEAELLNLLWAVGASHRWMHVERLQQFDGERGYTLAQGEDAA